MEALQLDTEARIRAHHSAREYGAAATLTLQAYGGTMQQFFISKLRSRALAEEAYLVFSEKLWRSLEGFSWACSLRAWLFMIAKSVASDLPRQAAVRRELPHAPDSAHFVQQVDVARSTTARFRQTGNKQRLQALREQLNEHDQNLLILRFGQELSWNEIAVAMGVVAPDADKAALAQAATRLRNEFDTARRRLRKLAMEQGFTQPD
jgi:RNA polymerase sigma factor (sigma-70 family)